MDLWCLNYTIVVIIPEKEGLLWPMSFGLLVSSTSSSRFMTKVLANQLRPYIHLLVDQVQLTFTKTRYVFNSVTCAHEILAASHNLNIEAIFFKLEFEKTFDFISCDILFELLMARRLGQRWIGWIKPCLLSGHHPSLFIKSRSTTFNA